MESRVSRPIWAGDFLFTERMMKMGRLIARELDNMKWGFYSCLLFIGISSPAFHQFYKKQ
ncbi:MAG: hypothetical protein EP148_05995 [Dialister invisus]|nr:hypothetical protein [Dialister invisus]